MFKVLYKTVRVEQKGLILEKSIFPVKIYIIALMV